MGAAMSAGAEGVKQPVGTCLAMHCLEPWFDPVPASVIGGAKMRHQTLPEPAQVEATPQDQAPELSPMDSLSAMLKRYGRTVEEVMQIGVHLLLLKESVPHGEFIPAVKRLGVSYASAQRFMAGWLRFHGLPQVRKHCFNESMLFTLLPLDDLHLDELERTGATGGLKLADMAGMTVKQLRLAVRAVQAGANPGHAAMLAKLRATDTPH